MLSFSQSVVSNNWQETQEGSRHNTVQKAQQLPSLCLSALVSVCVRVCVSCFLLFI